MGRHGGEPVVRLLRERLLRRVQEVRVRALAPAPHAPAELVELGEPEHVGPLQDERVGVGDVQAGLDDGGAHQDVELLLPEGADDLVQLVLAHLAVGHADPRLGYELVQPGGRPADRLDPVVHVEDLALAEQLTA